MNNLSRLAVFLALCIFSFFLQNLLPLNIVDQFEQSGPHNAINATSRANGEQLPRRLLYNKHRLRFDTAFARYRELHRQIVSGEVPTRVVFHVLSDTGYGNRIYALLSAFVVAILSDRAFLSDWSDINAFIDEPLPDTFRRYDGSNALNVRHDTVTIFDRWRSPYAWQRQKNMSLVMLQSVPSGDNGVEITRLLFRSYDAVFMEMCTNPAYYDRLLYYGLVAPETVDAARQLLRSSGANTNNADLQRTLFQIGFEVGGNLLNAYWIPKRPILSQVERVLREQFADNFVIGLQIRTEFLDLAAGDVEKFLDCAFLLENAHLNLSASEPNARQRQKRQVKWFVSSDSTEVLNNILATYPNKTFSASGGVIGNIFNNKRSYERTIIDMELLSNCDQLVITAVSTFGYVAAMKNAGLPFFIKAIDKHMKKDLPATDCTQLTFSDTLHFF